MTIKTFGLKVLGYGMICLLLLISLILILNWKVRQQQHNIFVLPEKYTGVILGSSHAACGFDDQYLPGYKNIGAVTESYLHVYIKLKNVLQANPQIKNVIVEVDNMQFSNRAMNNWLGAGAMSRLLPRYEPYMTTDQISLFFKNNPSEFIKTQQLLIQKNIDLLRKPNTYQVSSGKFGRNSRHGTTHADSLLAEYKPHQTDPNEMPNPISIDYLKRIVSLCQEKNVSLVFIRIPILREYEEWTNEEVFQKVITEKFSDVPFVDLMMFPLKTTDYYDLDHLNIYGNEKVSKFLNTALQQGQLNQSTVDSFIEDSENLNLSQ